MRPASIRISPAGGAGAQAEGTVALSTYLGAVVEHLVHIGGDVEVLVRGPGLGSGAAPAVPAGARVSLSWSAHEERLFGADGHPIEAAEGAPAARQEARENDRLRTRTRTG
ncbi:MAG: TOBE domain-containing protein [Acetobacteraceae bacterium]